MTVNAECPGCGEMKTLFDMEKGNLYECDCKAMVSKQAMADMQKLREKRLEMPCDYSPKFHKDYFTMWDVATAKEPTGISYEDIKGRVTV